MLVSYKRKSVQENNEFEYLCETNVGTKYPRVFWKQIKGNRPVCYWAINHKANEKEMSLVHKEISNRVTSLSFARGCRKNEQPMWEIIGTDEDASPKVTRYSHNEFSKLLKGSDILEMPFRLGENFYRRYVNIEASVPRGSELKSESVIF